MSAFLDRAVLAALEAARDLAARFDALPERAQIAVGVGVFAASLLAVAWIEGHTPGSAYY